MYWMHTISARITLKVKWNISFLTQWGGLQPCFDPVWNRGRNNYLRQRQPYNTKTALLTWMSLPLPRQEVRAQEPLWSCYKLDSHSRFGQYYTPLHSWGSCGQHTPLRFYLLDKNISDRRRSPAVGPTRVGWPEPEARPWSTLSGSTLIGTVS